MKDTFEILPLKDNVPIVDRPLSDPAVQVKHRLIELELSNSSLMHYRVLDGASIKEVVEQVARLCRFPLIVGEVFSRYEGDGPEIEGLINYLKPVQAWRLKKPSIVIASFKEDEVIPMTRDRYLYLKEEHRKAVRNSLRLEREMDELCRPSESEKAVLKARSLLALQRLSAMTEDEH